MSIPVFALGCDFGESVKFQLVPLNERSRARHHARREQFLARALKASEPAPLGLTEPSLVLHR